MKFLVKFSIVVLILGAIGTYGYYRVRAYLKERNKPNYRFAEVIEGEIVSVVNATGTVQPVLSVQVGAFVSGPIDELLAEFNDVVTEGQLLAKIDPLIYNARVKGDEASLETRKAEVIRAEALLEQAENDLQRAENLWKKNEKYISVAEMDRVKSNCRSAEAQVAVAKAMVKQAQASLDNSKANLKYTEITSPVAGKIIDRKIEHGQTLTAQFQTPHLFTVAPDMDKKMHVFASVDEADMGLIRDAERAKQKVEFTVDAYPDDLFEGTIYQVRLNPNTFNNVVTYPVVVEAPNPDTKLLPGMTANLSFHVARKKGVVKIPNAALRFYPKSKQVREEDRKLLEGVEDATESDLASAGIAEDLSAKQKVTASRDRERRHVWIVDGEFLKAVEVFTGLDNNRYTELVSGEIKEGQKLVTGIVPRL
jgi:HlyD family secretion protein